jgi:hypothetical protein
MKCLKFCKKNRFLKPGFLNSCKGQIALPALLVVPILLLFAYLLFETAKVSREKIRHQFALDSALFIEMTNQSDHLNRTAYTNGPFPYLIFQEMFDCPPDNYISRSDELDPDTNKECLFDILYEMGAYPMMLNDTGTTAGNDRLDVWKFEFMDRKKDSEDEYENLTDRDLEISSSFELTTYDKISKLDYRKSFAEIVTKVYMGVYHILGDIQEALNSTNKRLTADASFLRKSYYLNAGSCLSGLCAEEAASVILQYKLHTEMKYARRVKTHYKTRPTWTGGTIAAIPKARRFKSERPNGMFQLAIVRANFAGLWRGITTYQPFSMGPNYFDINLNNYGPAVRSTVSIVHPLKEKMEEGVWPNPTPKFVTCIGP